MLTLKEKKEALELIDSILDLMLTHVRDIGIKRLELQKFRKRIADIEPPTPRRPLSEQSFQAFKAANEFSEAAAETLKKKPT
jgi:hypothetical protein